MRAVGDNTNSGLQIKETEEQINIFEKNVREAESAASNIDANVFDLKAVNPNVVVKLDTRTALEIIENIETQSKIVEEAMKNLKLML